MYSITKEDANSRFSEILRVNVFITLTWAKLHARIHFDRKHKFQEIVILKQWNAKSVTDASILVKFISKNSNTLEIEHSLLNSPITIPRYGLHFRWTDLADNSIHRIPGQYVNKLQILFCDRAL